MADKLGAEVPGYPPGPQDARAPPASAWGPVYQMPPPCRTTSGWRGRGREDRTERGDEPVDPSWTAVIGQGFHGSPAG